MSFLQDLRLSYAGFIEVFDNARSSLNEKLLHHRAPSNPQEAHFNRILHSQCPHRTAIVTGSNQGVGYETAAGLLKRGCTVILACRSPTRASQAAHQLSSLESLPGFELGQVVVPGVPLDLASLESVREFVGWFQGTGRELDLLVCNAGIMAPPERIETKDGFELQFQSNYLGHWLLVNELSTSSTWLRIVFLTSLTHAAGCLDDIYARERYNAFQVYANTKLCTLLAAKEFHRRLRKKERGCATAVHPGIVNTNLARSYFLNEVPRVLKPVAVPILESVFFPYFLRTTEAAAATVLFGSLAPDQEVGGKYIKDSGVARCAEVAMNAELAEKLYKMSCELTGSLPIQ